jgi:N-acetylmuramoyl-L-alanine amidase
MLRQESRFGTDFDANSSNSHNPWNLKHASNQPWGGFERLPSSNGYTRFPDWVTGAAGWKARVTAGPLYKEGAYEKTWSIRDLIQVFAPPGDQIKTTTQCYVDDVVERLIEWTGESLTETISFGRVPTYGFEDRRFRVADKPEGVGWNNLGKRVPKFIVLHRMLGSLVGTDGYFADPKVASLTDFGIGVRETDGDRAGHIYQWADPTGYVSGWASGVVSAPYGDGKEIVDKYGVRAVNRDGISVEISGFADTTIDDFAWQELVHLCAWWVDFMEIPYQALPLNPHTGINTLIFHQEFTIGTGKECPYAEVMSRIQELYDDIKVFLRPYQTGNELPEPQPLPAVPMMVSRYSPPAEIQELSWLSDSDADKAKAIAIHEGTNFVFVNDWVRAVRRTRRRLYATEDAASIGPDIEAGEAFEVRWLVEAGDGQMYYITPWWSRVLVTDTERISD